MQNFISQAFVDGLKPGPKDIYIGDTELPGFRLKVTPAGKRVFTYSYRSPIDGRQRRITYERMSADEARLEAMKARDLIDKKGEDPQAEADAAKASPTLIAAFELYATDRANGGKTKVSTITEYRRLMKASVPERLRNKRVVEIKRKDIEELKRDMAEAKATANGVLRLLHAIFEWCEGQGQCLPKNTNPAADVELYPSNKRSCRLKDAELVRLSKALTDAELKEWPAAVGGLRLLILTGMRKQEVFGLSWEEVDFEDRVIRLKDAKRGARDVPLGHGAIAVLKGLAKLRDVFPSPYVVPSPKDRSKPFIGSQKLWERVRKKAGLPNLRIHDLRHNFGGMAAQVTKSAVHVRDLLGHAQIETTGGYMKLAGPDLNKAADAINDDILARLGNA